MHQQPGLGRFAFWALGTSDGYPGFSRNSALAAVCPPAERGVLLLHPSPACWLPPGPGARLRSPCWPGSFPSPGGGHWWVGEMWRRTQGYPFLWQCGFMMAQINSEAIASISCQCPSFYRASVFCPKSQIFLKMLLCLEMEATTSL